MAGLKAAKSSPSAAEARVEGGEGEVKLSVWLDLELMSLVRATAQSQERTMSSWVRSTLRTAAKQAARQAARQQVDAR